MKKIFVQTNAGLKRCTEHPCFPQKWWSCQIKWLLKQVMPGFQLNRILLVLSYIKLWYQSLVQRALPTVHYTDLDPRPVQHPYRGQCKCVCVSFGKLSSLLHLNTGPNSKFQAVTSSLWAVAELTFYLETSLRLQMLQVGPIKQWPRGSWHGVNQTRACFNRTQFTFISKSEIKKLVAGFQLVSILVWSLNNFTV